MIKSDKGVLLRYFREGKTMKKSLKTIDKLYSNLFIMKHTFFFPTLYLVENLRYVGKYILEEDVESFIRNDTYV